MDSGHIILFQTQGGNTKIDVRFSNESMWQADPQKEEQYQTTRLDIVQYIKNIHTYELDEIATSKKSLQVLLLGNSEQLVATKER